MPKDLSLENPLAVMGDEDVVLGLRALGFRVYSPQEPDHFKIALDELIKDKTAICLVQDNIYHTYKDQIDSYKRLPLPIFIPFSKTGKTDLLDEIIKDIRLKATGAF